MRALIFFRERPHWLLMMPAVLLLLGFLMVPIVTLIGVSLQESVPIKRFEPGLTLESYVRALTDSFFVRQLGRTLEIASISTAFCVLLGYPTAYLIWRSRGIKKMFFLALILLPLFTNIIARIYAWLLVLAKDGPLNSFLVTLGVVDDKTVLNFGFWPVIVGVTYVALPYFILIVYSTLEGIEWSLVEGARTLGAGRLRSIREIVIPLSAPGLAGAVAVAFTWGVGAFAEPTILGSPREWTTGVEASQQLFQNSDWPFAAALSFILVAVTLTFVVLSLRLVMRRRGLVGT